VQCNATLLLDAFEPALPSRPDAMDEAAARMKKICHVRDLWPSAASQLIRMHLAAICSAGRAKHRTSIAHVYTQARGLPPPIRHSIPSPHCAARSEVARPGAARFRRAATRATSRPQSTAYSASSGSRWCLRRGAGREIPAARHVCTRRGGAFLRG
jgi:hypothetical protein